MTYGLLDYGISLYVGICVVGFCRVELISGGLLLYGL